MNNNLQIFNHEEFGELRTLEMNNENWFVGKDVAEKLGYRNIPDAIKRHVDEDDKGVVKHDTLGGSQSMTIINESGLYSLILSSKLPTAKKFKRWVTSEVLPSIRKNGGYIHTDEDMSDEEIMAKALQVAQKTIEKKNKEIETLKPLATYTERILQSTGLFTATQIGKDYGLSGQEFNKLLNQVKIQYKQNGQWLLYARFQDKGYTGSETIPITHSDGRPDAKMNTKWTQEGRLFLYEFLKVKGIVPKIERGYKKEQISLIN